MSDQDQNVFASAAPSATAIDLGNLPEVSELVGEGRKYKTPEEALKSVPHAQKHIQELEGTLANLRTELAQRMSLEEAVTELRAGNKPIESTEGSVNQTGNILDEDGVAKLVEKVVEGRESARVQRENQSQVVAALKAVYGDKAEEVYNSKMASLGMAHEEFTALASKSPKAALALFPEAGTIKPSSGSVTTGSVRTESFAQTGQVKAGTYAWYNNLRKTDPKTYFSREIQVEMARRAAELGQAFYT